MNGKKKKQAKKKMRKMAGLPMRDNARKESKEEKKKMKRRA